MGDREARLRPEWAEDYPGIEPGRWYEAAQLVPLVLRHRIQRNPGLRLGWRILVDEHFEFRGGLPRGDSWGGILSRIEDG